MQQQGRWTRTLGGLILALGLSTSAGCMSFLHPVDPTGPELVAACRELPKCARDHVYVFIIHGMDPLDFANLEGLCKYMHDLGFNNTYYGQLYHTWQIEKDIRRIYHEDPEARFALIGFSFGANMVRSVTQHVNNEGIRIDLLVYLGGNTLDNVPADRPDNTGQIVNILASGCIWNGAWLDDAINEHETDVWHFGSPTHPRTLQILNEQLIVVASTVPVPAEPTKIPSTPEPTPREVMPPAVSKNDAWDFLKPVSRLKELPADKTTDSPPPADTPDKKTPVKEKIAMR